MEKKLRDRLDKKFEIVSTCDSCGSYKYKLFIKSRDLNFRTGEYIYVSCDKCGLVRLSPRPKKEYLANYYPSGYTAYSSQTKPTIIQRFVRKLIKNNKLLARILIKDQLFFADKRGKILDVGCGSGKYLQILNGWGWDTFGIEINKKAVLSAKENGIKNIKCGDFEKTLYNKNFFDVVNFSQVLEHTSSPTQVLKKTAKILKSGGLVVIKVPNIDSLFFKIFKSYWFPLEPPRHLFQFTRKTITRLLQTNGFTNIKIEYNQSTYSFLWSLFYLFGFDNVEKKFGSLTYPLSLLLRFLNFFKLSDGMEITARKSI